MLRKLWLIGFVKIMGRSYLLLIGGKTQMLRHILIHHRAIRSKILEDIYPLRAFCFYPSYT